MSSYLVSKHHIDALVTAALTLDVYVRAPAGDPRHGRGCRASEVDPTVLGLALYAENVRSMRTRYEGRFKVDESEGALVYNYSLFAPFSKDDFAENPAATVAAAFKACDCYDYQACETDDYATTWAAGFVDAIRGALPAKLPGYSSAPWGIDHPHLNG